MAEMRNNTAGYLADRTGLDYMPSVPCVSCHMADNNAGLPNHTFRPDPRSCSGCHNTTFPSPDVASGFIEMITSITQAGVDGAEPRVEEAFELIEQMRGNRTSENLDSWMVEYERALFNLETVVSDNSEGNHNPRLAAALLNDALNRSSNVIANLTPPAKIANVSASWLDNGDIRITWDPSGATDFVQYRIYVLTSPATNITSQSAVATVNSVAASTHDLSGISNATAVYVYVTAVDSDGNEITNSLVGALVVGNLENIIKDLEDSLADLHDQLDSLQTQYDNLEDTNAVLEEDVASLEDRVTSLQDERLMWAVIMLAIGVVVGVLAGMMLSRWKPAKPKEGEPPAEDKG